MRVLAVDLSNVYRANWEAASGKNDQGSLAFRATVQAVVDAREGFDRVAICCDSGGPSFRKAIDPRYKAHRERPPEAYYEQQRRAVERLQADGCAVFVAPKVETQPPGSMADEFYAEADDVIAALCSWADKQGTVEHVRILGSDKDLLALVNDGGRADEDMRIRIDVRRLDGAIFDAAAVEAKIGLPPAKVPDWLGLAGDGSDGFKPYPGEMNEQTKRRGPGIGDKGAVKLLRAFGDIEGIFGSIEDQEVITDHERKILKTHGIDAGRRGLALATLRWDLPIDFSPLLTEPVMKPIAERKPAPEVPPAPPSAPEVIGEPVSAPPPARPAPSAEQTAMVRVEASPVDINAFQPRGISELELVATIAFNSRCYAQFGNVEQVMMAIAEARERRIPVGVALRNAYVVKGKLAWSASLMAALVMQSKVCKRFRIIETTAERAVLEYQRTDDEAPRTFDFTIDEARQAGWMKSGEKGDGKWLTNPRTMLRWAAMREAARAFFPDVVSGMFSPDEIRGGYATDDDIGDVGDVAT